MGVNAAFKGVRLVTVDVIIRKVGIVTTLRAILPRVQIPAHTREIIFFKRFISALGPIQMGTGVVLVGNKVAGTWISPLTNI